MKTKYNWQPIEEMDLDDGTHTCFGADDGSYFLYCTQIADGTWDCETQRKIRVPGLGTITPCGFITHANCKTLSSAKRWFARYW